MREMLFRGKPKNEADYQLFAQTYKDKCNNGFVFGSLVVCEDKYYICVSALCKVNSLICNGITTMIEVDSLTIGEFTGLTDKNGNRIFEADIVKAEIWYELGCYSHTEIEQIEVKIPVIYKLKFEKCEIIGNIHDNPELMKGGVDNG